MGAPVSDRHSEARHVFGDYFAVPRWSPTLGIWRWDLYEGSEDGRPLATRDFFEDVYGVARKHRDGPKYCDN